MEAALSTLLEFGVERIEGHILALTNLLMTELHGIAGVRVITPDSKNERAGIVTIEFTKSVDTKAVFNRLVERDVAVSLREGKLRYSPHFYNSPVEIAEAVAATREAIGD
jgi:selenocysteine lyase/cysteine desulfurase